MPFGLAGINKSKTHTSKSFAGRNQTISIRGTYRRTRPAMFATAVRVDRAIETDVRRLVARQYRLGDLAAHLGGAGRRDVLFPAIVVGLAARGREAVVRVNRRTAAAWCGNGQGHVFGQMLFIYTVNSSSTARQAN